ncbi:MAG: cupin domain-containing protein [Betaproteobacteria bacterium]|nr:cupin domain-containing protein [Betaproteobacteria bacterium]
MKESAVPTQPPLPRILVSGHTPEGRSTYISDGPPHKVRTVEERPGYRVSNIWAIFDSPAPIDDPDRINEVVGLAPPPMGSLIRIIDYPPEPRDPVERKKMFEAMFSKLFPDGRHLPPDAVHPGMHTTESIDYAIVLQGEIYAVMEEGEKLMRAGDVLIQRGTAHAWSNRSNEFARICFVLIDGKRG